MTGHKKIKADFDLCEANGLCVGFAPDVFELDDNDYLELLTDEVTSENEVRVQQAVASCPRTALSIVSAADD